MPASRWYRESMRVVFLGTPAFSTPTLERIASDGHTVVAIYTRAPKPAGRRGLELLPSPVHQEAERMGVPVLTPASLRGDEASELFRSHRADVAIVVAYGLLLPRGILDAPGHGCLNLHASLLPRWRGAAPIQRAIMAGDAMTGVDLMRMEEGLDTGPISLRRVIPIEPKDTAGNIAGRLSAIAAELAGQGLGLLERGELSFRQQEGVACYAHKIHKRDADIDWSRKAAEVRNQIHGLSPLPGAFSTLTAGNRRERIKIYRAEVVSESGAPGAVLSHDMTIACGEGAIRILEGQRAGRTTVRGRQLMGGEPMAGASFTLSEGPAPSTGEQP